MFPAHEVPDLPGFVVGWRWWNLTERGGHPWLVGPVTGSWWPARAEMVAGCRRCPARHVPGPWCECGVYAVADLAAAANTPRHGQVLGCVALWGQVVEAQRGWRASRGYPLVLFTQPELGERTRDALAERYGVEVNAAPADLGALIRLGGAPIHELGEHVRGQTAGGHSSGGSAAELLTRMRQTAPRVRARARRRATMIATGCLWLLPAFVAASAGALARLAGSWPPPWSWLVTALLALVGLPLGLAAMWIGLHIGRVHVLAANHWLVRMPTPLAVALLTLVAFPPPLALLTVMLE